VLALSVGPASADERPFRTLFGEGYEFLQKKGEAPVPVVPDRAVVRDGQAFRTLFGEGYGVVRQAGQTVGRTRPVIAGQPRRSLRSKRCSGKGMTKSLRAADKEEAGR
jgi:hypothetical protein